MAGGGGAHQVLGEDAQLQLHLSNLVRVRVRVRVKVGVRVRVRVKVRVRVRVSCSCISLTLRNMAITSVVTMIDTITGRQKRRAKHSTGLSA